MNSKFRNPNSAFRNLYLNTPALSGGANVLVSGKKLEAGLIVKRFVNTVVQTLGSPFAKRTSRFGKQVRGRVGNPNQKSKIANLLRWARNLPRLSRDMRFRRRPFDFKRSQCAYVL